MPLLEKFGIVASLHQFDKTQAQRLAPRPIKECAEFIVVYAAHQHGVDLDRRNASLLRLLDAVQHFGQFIVAGDAVKFFCIQTIDTDI